MAEEPVDDWDALDDGQQVVVFNIAEHDLVCRYCAERVCSLGMCNLIEGTAEDFNLVVKAYSLPCGCRQSADIDPEVLEQVLLMLQEVQS